MLSNTIRRDVQTRTGFVLASTTMRNSEYLVGKFFGNFVFLLAITIGFIDQCHDHAGDPRRSSPGALLLLGLLLGHGSADPRFSFCSFPCV